MSVQRLLLLVGLLAGPLPLRADPPYPPPKPPRDPSGLGLGIQRTMTLLATSTPERRNRVRILFYGQSITEQEWSRIVADDLRKRFPHAELTIENRAIGGFASQLLLRPAEHDLYPFYPDLLIFHVYGSHIDYERIIRGVRSRTTAEVLMQTDHATAWPPEVVDPAKDKAAWWTDFMNHHFLPDTAKKYGCGLVDVHSAWLDYLRDNHLEPKALLKDGVHLNEYGNFLMAELIKRYLVHRLELAKGAGKDLVKTYEVGKDIAAKDGRLVLDVDGNRIDAILARGSTREARVLVDGRSPAELPGVYRITRPQPGPWSPLALTRVDHDTPLTAEDWRLRVTSVADDGKTWHFTVEGSRTGSDGEGESASKFVSRSGRVRIEPESWFRNGGSKLSPGYEITWKVLPTFLETITPLPDPGQGLEPVVTLVQGMPNSRHRLEIVSEGAEKESPIVGLRVYRPPLREEPGASEKPSQ